MTKHLFFINKWSGRGFKIASFSTLFVLFTTLFYNPSYAAADAKLVAEGKTLFKANCASCHNPKADGTGPALEGVSARWEAAGAAKGKDGKAWLHEWVKNWNTPVNAGYGYAVAMANSRASQMNLFPALKDEDIDKILLYVDNSTMGSTEAKPKEATAATEAPKEESNLFLWILGAVLLVLALTLISVTNRLDKVIADSKGETIVKNKFWKTRKFKAFLILAGILAFGFWLADNAIRLGRQQSYQPTQPIRFNHQLHAGKHKIECQYCHTSASKSKTSGIPTLNTCMNCHKNVKSGPEYGTTEIAKIYNAVGWDVKEQKYTRPAKPVEWVRIHNLPDHVYFNHAQHVTAGKVECQTCHGPVETMKEVYQYAPLSMGWCVNCHRQTEVQFGSNNYYSTYEKLHQDLKDKKIDKVTVEKIGGTECAKCHY